MDVVRSSTTSTQAFQWAEFLHRRGRGREKIDHLVALVRHDLHLLTCAVLQAEPWRELEECYPQWAEPEEPSSPEAEKRAKINRDMRMQASQMAWANAVGIDLTEVEGWTTGGKPPEARPRKPAKATRTLRD